MSMLSFVVLILIVLSATLAASETALFSMARLEHTREQMSLSVQRALDRLPRRHLLAGRLHSLRHRCLQADRRRRRGHAGSQVR